MSCLLGCASRWALRTPPPTLQEGRRGASRLLLVPGRALLVVRLQLRLRLQLVVVPLLRCMQVLRRSRPNGVAPRRRHHR